MKNKYIFEEKNFTINPHSFTVPNITDTNIWMGMDAVRKKKKVQKDENGSKIHIKKENEGKFTEAANRAGMSVQQFAAHVLSNKDKYSGKLIKRANFARNAAKWK